MTEGMAPFHSALTPTQTVPFNAVEEWTVSNSNGYPHPFHIHIDCYVVKVNGEPVEPFWADTLPLPPASATGVGSITFRMRFVDFHGEFVWHCHALDHEDLGMTVKIVADDKPRESGFVLAVQFCRLMAAYLQRVCKLFGFLC
ncbi:multicopper oxidase domain-containing protein [Staphylococcus epidermidis]|nr:multicopper oxidase domain-containing protein [Staphylococcus epidermidis]